MPRENVFIRKSDFLTWNIHAEMFKDVWAKATITNLHLNLRRRYGAWKITCPSYLFCSAPGWGLTHWHTVSARLVYFAAVHGAHPVMCRSTLPHGTLNTTDQQAGRLVSAGRPAGGRPRSGPSHKGRRAGPISEQYPTFPYSEGIFSNLGEHNRPCSRGKSERRLASGKEP